MAEGFTDADLVRSAITVWASKELMDASLPTGPEPPNSSAAKEYFTEKQRSGFVFKFKANRDPKHRDRVAFVRLPRAIYPRLKLTQSIQKFMSVTNPVMSLAADRELERKAWAVTSRHSKPRQLRIGDTLTEGERSA